MQSSYIQGLEQGCVTRASIFSPLYQGPDDYNPRPHTFYTILLNLLFI